jgi:hypothetical protein
MAKQDKGAAKQTARQKRSAMVDRVKQIYEAFRIQRKEDRWLLPLMLVAFFGPLVVVFLVGMVFRVQWTALPIGIMLGVLGAMLIFGRRVQSNVFRKAEGQPGAAAWALENLRGRWILAQAVAGTSQLDAVHRVIGRPGVLLVGEGAPHRLKSLMGQEKKRVARVVGETPIYEIVVGNNEDQVPLRKLHSHISKLPRNISSGQMDALENRLSALATRGNAQPKGPMPQGARMRNMQRAMRRR